MQWKVVLFLSICWRTLYAYKILIALPATSFSHYLFASEITKALVAEGHELTVISRFKLAKPLPNYEELYIGFNQSFIRSDHTILVYKFELKNKLTSFWIRF